MGGFRRCVLLLVWRDGVFISGPCLLIRSSLVLEKWKRRTRMGVVAGIKRKLVDFPAEFGGLGG